MAGHATKGNGNGNAVGAGGESAGRRRNVMDAYLEKAHRIAIAYEAVKGNVRSPRVYAEARTLGREAIRYYNSLTGESIRNTYVTVQRLNKGECGIHMEFGRKGLIAIDPRHLAGGMDTLEITMGHESCHAFRSKKGVLVDGTREYFSIVVEEGAAEFCGNAFATRRIPNLEGRRNKMLKGLWTYMHVKGGGVNVPYTICEGLDRAISRERSLGHRVDGDVMGHMLMDRALHDTVQVVRGSSDAETGIKYAVGNAVAILLFMANGYDVDKTARELLVGSNTDIIDRVCDALLDDGFRSTVLRHTSVV